MAIDPEKNFPCSVVVPVYNEENNVIPLTERLIKALQSVQGCAYEIIFALDPSTDRTEDIILSLRAGNPRIKLLRFSRRFGQPAATLGGLRHAGGEVCVIIDADLQDPPELIPKLLEKWQTEGAVIPSPIMAAAVEILRPHPQQELIWASPRELLNVFQASAIGCHIITSTVDILKKLDLTGKDLTEYSLETVRMFRNDAIQAGFQL